MTFPNSDRVHYRKNPLIEVICQIKFPPILRISSNEPPAGFQDRIRADYPRYAETTQQQGAIPMGIPDEVIKALSPMLPATRIHAFGSADEVWTVSLARDFLALSTTTYSNWESFRDRLKSLLHSLQEEYTPEFFSRIGLRYKDIIRPSELDLENIPWSDLLSPCIAGEFSDSEIANKIQRAAREVRIQLEEDDEFVMIRHGLVFAEPTKEACFLIDADFFTETEVESDNVIERLDRFNGEAGNLFRWSMQPRLLTALEPERVDG